MERSWRLATARQAGPAAWVKLELVDGTALLLCMQPVLRAPAAEDPPLYERRQPKIQNLALCKKKIPRHIKLTVHAWSTKC